MTDFNTTPDNFQPEAPTSDDFISNDPAPAVDDDYALPVEDDPAPAVSADENEDDAPKERAPRNSNLESDLRLALEAIYTGADPLPEGTQATPHTLAKRIDVMRGEDAPDVSPGAVSAAFDRWVECGYIVVLEKPKRFEDYTDAGRTEGLSALKGKMKDAKKAERAAARAAKAAANQATVDAAVEADATAPF